MPSDQVSRQSFNVKSLEPVIGSRTELNGILAWREAALNDSTCIYEAFLSKSIDLHCVPEMRMQESIDWVHSA